MQNLGKASVELWAFFQNFFILFSTFIFQFFSETDEISPDSFYETMDEDSNLEIVETELGMFFFNFFSTFSKLLQKRFFARKKVQKNHFFAIFTTGKTQNLPF